MEKTVASKQVKHWLKDKYNLLFLAIIIFAAILRISLLIHTQGQTFWWDEAEYGATAKHFSSDLYYPLNVQRPFIFPWIVSLFISVGLGETFIKFLVVIIPSIALVVSIYMLGTRMFSKPIGLISAFLASISWTFLFWSTRLQPDFASMFFQVMSIFFMWGYWQKPKTSSIMLAAVFASLGFQFKVSGLLVPAIFLVFVLLKEHLTFLKKKDYWIALATFVIVLIPQLIYTKIVFGSVSAFFLGSGYAGEVLVGNPIGWYVLKFFYSLLNVVLFVLFIIGLIMSLKFVLYLDILAKNKEKFFDASIFSVLSLIIVAAFYIFYIRGAEDRWLFLWLPFLFFLIGQALLYIYSKLKTYGTALAIIAVVALLAIAAYGQIKQGTALIDSKEQTYLPVKLAGLWIRDHSNPSDVVLSISYPQTAYYSERTVKSYSAIKNESDFDSILEKEHPRYFTQSLFEPHPPTIQDWINHHQDRLTIVQVYSLDKDNTQPVLIIYEVKYG